jgi:hypothetical protein
MSHHFLKTRSDEDVLIWFAYRTEREMLSINCHLVFHNLEKENERRGTFFLTNPTCDYLICFGGQHETDGLIVMGHARNWIHELMYDVHRLIGLNVPDLASGEQKPEYRLFATDLFLRNWGRAIGIDIEAESNNKLLRFRLNFEQCRIKELDPWWKHIARPGFLFSHLHRRQGEYKIIPGAINTESFELMFEYENVTVEKLSESDRTPDEPSAT